MNEEKKAEEEVGTVVRAGVASGIISWLDVGLDYQDQRLV